MNVWRITKIIGRKSTRSSLSKWPARKREIPGAECASHQRELQALLCLGHRHQLVARVVLAPSPAQDSNVIVTTPEVAARHRLGSVSDLADVAPRLVFGGPPECPIRPFCLQGLERTYGLHFGRVLSLDAGGPLTHQVLADGDADVALLFSTDSKITDEGLVVLRDDRHLQPAENITPIVHQQVVKRFGPGFTALVNDVSSRLTTEALRSLNASVAAGGRPGAVATAWLAREGLA